MNTQHGYIAIEGVIGAGKTTLARLLAERLGARLVLEEFADNPFLARFYAEPERYAFPLELSFLAARYAQLRPVLLEPDLFAQPIISDYYFQKTRLFARVNLPDAEYRLFQNLYDIIAPQLRPPDVLIFLQSPLERLRRHITSRGRDYEAGIEDGYLEDLAEVYAQALRHPPCPTLVIDASQADFLAPNGHLETLLNVLAEPLHNETRFLTLD